MTCTLFTESLSSLLKFSLVSEISFSLSFGVTISLQNLQQRLLTEKLFKVGP
jgi:hypothetical protein